MKMRLTILTVIACVAGLAQSAQTISREGGYWVQTVHAKADSEGIRGLELTTWGDISLQGGDADEISYTLKKRVRANSESEAARLINLIESRAVRRGSMLSLRIECSVAHCVAPELIVNVPRTLVKTYLETHGGNIHAQGLDGKLIAKTGGGRISADNIGDGVHAETAGGEIRLGRIGGVVKCISGAGNILVGRAGGNAWLETAGGQIVVEEAMGEIRASTGGGNIHVGKAAGSVVANTMGGVIEIGEAGGLVVAENGGGAIVVRSAPGVKCQSASGAIRLTDVSGALRAMTASGNIIAKLIVGAALEDSFLDTSHGDVTVFIPSNLAVTVRAHNQAAGTGGRIVSDFSEIQVRRLGRSGYGPVLAEGTINGGGPLLKISAIGGTIFLRRR